MHDGAEIGAKVNKHGAKSLETQATSDNVQYDKRACHTPTVITLPNVRQSHQTHHAYLVPNNAPQASLTPTNGIQDDDY